MENKYPMVSFIVVARNAADHIPGALADFLAQDYPKERIEFLFVDGKSSDATGKIVADFTAANPGINFKLIVNPGKTLASGWNCALREAKGDIILRIDAHAGIPPDFISKNVEVIGEGHEIAGGPLICTPPEKLWPLLLSLADASRFGGGAADFRNLGSARYVDTLAYAAYKRDVFRKTGGYNELLVRNQDNEMHYRMKKAGYKFWFTPEIRSFYTPRAELFRLLKQKFGNGYWIALVVAISPRCFGFRHFVPFSFICALCVATAGALFTTLVPLYVLLSVYFVVAALFALQAVWRGPAVLRLLGPLLPCVFFLMHVFYGLGTLCGLAVLPYKWKELRAYKPPFPVAVLKI